MATFREKEQHCLHSFMSSGPYWHVYTPGRQTGIIFKSEEDYSFAMNVMAQSALQYPGVKVISFAIMSNHVHILASGQIEEITEYFVFFKKRLTRGLFSGGDRRMPNEFVPCIKEVADLSSIRNTIVYINRNGYVADASHTPFSYPWGTCGFYFNRFFQGAAFKSLSTATKRMMFRGRVPIFAEDAVIMDGYVAPVSYCAIRFGMALFRDAHHYFAMLSKNVEGYSGVAADLDDDEFMTDTELFTQISAIVKTKYGLRGITELSKAQKIELAGTLHYDFKSSNGQIRRILGLSQYETDSLFPLSAKTQQ